jgi:RimJ/RimL family protein N-acetyltransferase
LHLKRVVATTDYDNVASLGVMRKLGMRIEKNPRREPPWLQVAGIVDNNRGPN